MGNSKNTAQLQAEQAQAAKLALPNPGAAGQSSFDIKSPVKLVKFDTSNPDQPGFTFEQNGVQFGAGTFSSQKSSVLKFDPTKPFQLANRDQFGYSTKTPTLTQGGLSFSIPNPVALTSPSDASTISPNGSANGPLARVPARIATGNIVSTAASRSLSGADYTKSKAVGLKIPLLGGS